MQHQHTHTWKQQKSAVIIKSAIAFYYKYWPVEILLQFDGLLCFQVTQATQKASGGVKYHLEELEHSKTRHQQGNVSKCLQFTVVNISIQFCILKIQGFIAFFGVFTVISFYTRLVIDWLMHYQSILTLCWDALWLK